MKSTNERDSRPLDRNNYIMNLMSLKLAQSSNTHPTKSINQSHHTPLRNLVINTPSTHATQKKFHSCELQPSKHQFTTPLTSQKRSQSATKILTINQIKTHQRQGSDSTSKQKSLNRQKSKGIFVSISRKNSLSKQQIKRPFLQDQDCRITNSPPKGGIKLKLNKYKDIAKQMNTARKLNFS